MYITQCASQGIHTVCTEYNVYRIHYSAPCSAAQCSVEITVIPRVITQAVPVQSSALAVHGNQHFTSAAQCSAVQCSAVPCTTHCTISTISTVQSSAAQCSTVQALTVIPRAAHRHSHGRPPPSQMAIYSGAHRPSISASMTTGSGAAAAAAAAAAALAWS